MNIYVGNLAKDVEDNDLRKAFEVYGKVDKAAIVKDKFSGESRGFGFVEMATKTEAAEAIQGLNSQELKGRYLIVNEARPRKDGEQRGGGRGGHRGSSGGGQGRGGFRSW
jgi:RNA recognition motif-containing protein